VTAQTVFDRNALAYDRWFDENPRIFQTELSVLRKCVMPNANGVEIGAGTGRFAVPLGIRSGVEPSFPMARIASARGVRMVLGKAESLPLRSAQFDMVLMNTVICFLDSPEIAFKEIFRILKKNGSFVCGFIEKHSFLGNKYRKNRKKDSFYKTASFYSVQDIEALLKNAGFSSPAYIQALFHNQRGELVHSETRAGNREGSYVVVRAMKTTGPQ
jgi:ubiquinone/menaquinone biosynthesis C-methylase UbiE